MAFSLSFCIMRTRQQRAEPPWPSLCSACQRKFASRQQNHNIYFITAFIITDLFIAQSHLNQGTRDCWWIISITFFVDGFNSFERPGTFNCVCTFAKNFTKKKSIKPPLTDTSAFHFTRNECKSMLFLFYHMKHIQQVQKIHALRCITLHWNHQFSIKMEWDRIT